MADGSTLSTFAIFTRKVTLGSRCPDSHLQTHDGDTPRRDAKSLCDIPLFALCAAIAAPHTADLGGEPPGLPICMLVATYRL